jgi:type II secretory pathway component GspD/PulD (secretin)
VNGFKGWKIKVRWAALAMVLTAVIAVGAGPSHAQNTSSTDGLLISLDADSSQVNSLLQILAERSQLNIVTSPDVQRRRISIHLKNTPFDEALNIVVRAAGLGYERIGNSILVGDPERLATQTGLTARAYTLSHADAIEVQKSLTSVIDGLNAYASGNQVIARGTPSQLDQVEQLLAQIDLKPRQVSIEARLIEVSTNDLTELGVQWDKITKWTEIFTEGDPGSSPTDELPSDSDYIKFDRGDDWFRQRSAYEVAIDFLITTGRGKLLANSRVTTAENFPADIFVGQTIRVVTNILVSNEGVGTTQTQIENIEVGVKLEATPRIASDGTITTLIAPEVSNILSLDPETGLPTTATRRARSLVRVVSGEKIILGGLLREESRDIVQKVPLLGDIPFLGYLFQHKIARTEKTDLVIEITPTIVEGN